MKTRLILVLALLGTAVPTATAQDLCTWEIGVMGALTGDFAHYGKPVAKSIELAVAQANEDGQLACELAVVKRSTQGDPNQAPAIAEELVGRENLVACLCGFFSGETLATGSIFSDAGVAQVSSGTYPHLDEQGFKTYFRAVAADNYQGTFTATYVKRVIKPNRVVVIHDNQDYSQYLAKRFAMEMGNDVVATFVINPENSDYSSTVVKVRRKNADFIYYGGYTPQAAPLAKQLDEGGVNAQFMGVEGALDDSFIKLAGPAAKGALFSSAYVDPTQLRAADGYTSAYKDMFGSEPRLIGLDMYDATNIVVEALVGATPAETTELLRARVVDYFDATEDSQRISKSFTWDNRGDLDAGKDSVWIFKVKKGKFNMLGSVKKLI